MSKRLIDETMDVGPEPGPVPGPRDAATMELDAPPVASAWLISAIRSATDLPVVERSHYQVMAEHARGGLGRILRAKDKRTGRIVAIKEMLSAPSDEIARRFAREALLTANLQHPSIIPVYELGRWQTGELFYAMKFVTGSSFKAVIGDCKTLDERLARLPIVLSVADALAYAHARRVIHRDLKPANVLVGDLGETVVIDWGLAKSIGEADPGAGELIVLPESIAPAQTVAGAVMGTPSYMPPEQARGEPTDERADVYQIGALLYHLIAGVPPYAGRNASNSKELIRIVAQDSPLPLIDREPGAPSDLVTIVAKAMARAPADRYENAGALGADLRRFTTGQLVQAHHYDRRTLLARWLRRNRAPVTVGSVLAAALIVFATWSVRRIVAERDQIVAQRDIAQKETRVAQDELATALFEKGRAAETAQEWSRAAMYYAAARRQQDTPARAWAAGLAEARAVFPRSRHEGHTAWVHAAAISPDGKRVATVDDAGQLRVWAPEDGHLFGARAVSSHALRAVAFAPDGRELAVAGDDGAISRLTAELAPIATLRGHTGRIWTLAYSPDGSLLASGGEDKTIRLWPAAGGAPRELDGHTQRVYAVAFSPDGKQLASGSDDRQLWLWDVATGKGAKRGDHKAGGIRTVAFSSDGQTILTSGWDHAIRVWPGSGAPQEWIDSDVIASAAIAPGGDIVVTGGEMTAIHAWEVSTHRLITSLEDTDQTDAVAFSRDGRWLITAGKSAPVAWDATALRRLVAGNPSREVMGLAFTRDGTRFASGADDHTVRLWDAATGAELRRIVTGGANCADGVLPLDDGELISACDDGMLRRWDTAGHVRELPTTGWLRLTSLSQDGATLAAGHEAGRLALVDLASWKITQTRQLHAHNIYGVQYAGDRIVTASLDDHVRVWRAADLAQDTDVKVGTDNGVLAAALAPDGKLLAIGTQDGSLDVWDVAGARWVARDLGGGKLGTVWKLAYAPDGASVLTASDDGLLRIWSTRTWTAEGLDAGEGPALALAISRDGTRAAAGYKSGAIAVWDLRRKQLQTRIGGQTRDRGDCADLATQAWADAAHRTLVATACSTDAPTYFLRLAARTHQRLDDGQIDVTWDWPR